MRRTSGSSLKKEQLIVLAKSGGKRPACGKHPLGWALFSYTAQSKKATYDTKFDTLIRQLRPDWFENTADEKRALLIEIAKSGADKPKSNSRLYYSLCGYTTPTNSNRGTYDPKFDTLIRQLRPDWFENTADAKKIALIEMAKNGEPRPKQHSKNPLARALGSYTLKNECSYDKGFDEKIRKLRPDWFAGMGKHFTGTQTRLEFVQAAFAADGSVLLAKHYTNAQMPMAWICSCGNRKPRPICWMAFKRGCRCFECGTEKISEAIKLKLPDVIEKFAQARLELLSSEYNGEEEKLPYRCLICGHEDTISVAILRLGSECRACGKKRLIEKIKLGIAVVKQRFLTAGMALLVDDYNDSKEHLPYRCLTCGYEGVKTLSDVSHCQTGCPSCYEDEKLGWCDSDDFAGGMKVLIGEEK